MSDGTEPREVSIGIDVGGTKIAAGLVDAAGHVLLQLRRPTRPVALLTDLETMSVELAEVARLNGLQLIGIGIGAKGAVDRVAKRLVNSIYLGHADLPIGDELTRALGLPIWLENDVHAATIGEMLFGVGRKFSDFVLFNAGTGISVGIVSGKRLYRGSTGVAGENGHVSMDQSGNFPCPCGLGGCLETMIISGRGGQSLPRITDTFDPEPGLAAVADYLLTSMLDLLNLVHPQALVLAGGMFELPSTVEWMRRWLHRLGPTVAAPVDSIEAAFGGPDAGLVGAGALPFHRAYL